MKVKEVMTQKVKSISPETNAREALGLLLEMRISGLPVIDSQNKLIGMFTEKDVLRYVLPGYIEKVGHFIYEENPKSVKKKFAELSNVTVDKLMRREVLTVSEDNSLCEAARMMLTKVSRRMPVLDKSGKVIGIVSRADILKKLAQEA